MSVNILSSRVGGICVKGAPLEIDSQVFCREEIEAEDGFGDGS
jgi:hypothetical protein